MMQLFLFALSALLIGVSWRLVWDKTMASFTRDRLFDLRDQVVREFFLKNYSLDNEAYAGLRDIINRHLQLTRRLSLPGFLFSMALLERKNLANQEISAFIDRRLLTSDNNLRDFIINVRKRAAMIMLQHMVSTSVLAVIFFLAAFPFFLLQQIIAFTSSSLDRLVKDSAIKAAEVVGKTIIHKPEVTIEGAAFARRDLDDCCIA